MEVEVTGVGGHRVRYDPMRQLATPGRPGTTMSGHYEGVDVASGAPVYVRRVNSFDDADTFRRVRHAIEVGRSVAHCPTLVQLVDYEDSTFDGHGYGDPELVIAVWEWGERVLLDELSGDYDAAPLAAEIEANVGAALDCLHAAGLVHCDVAPNNIVRVAGTWKLADFDHVVAEGEPVTGLPHARRYVLEGMDVGKPARREMDRYGLRAVVKRIAPS